MGKEKNGTSLKKHLKWLFELTAKSRGALLSLLLINTSVAVATVLVSLVNKSIVDKAGDQEVLRTMITLMIALQLFSIAGGVIESLFESVITEKYACRVRKDLFDRVLHLPWMSRTSYHSEELLSRMTSDVEKVTSGVSSLIISCGSLLVRLVLAFFLLWNYAPFLAVALIIIAPVGVLAGKLISRGMNKIQKEYQQNEADYRIFLQERLSKIDLVQIFGQEENSLDRLQDLQEKRLSLVRKKNQWKVLGTGVIGMTFTGAQMTAFVVGALMVNEGTITFGVMTAFLSLVGQIQGPIYLLANQIPQIVGVLASAGRIMEVCELEEERPDADLSAGNDGAVVSWGLSANSVSAGYKEDDIVRNISFDIKPGQMVMIAGKSGAGKTTLLRTVMGFLPQSSGDLAFYTDDGFRKKCDANTRRMISYVPQGNTLMFGTIADNLRMGKSDATVEEMNGVLKIADALDFVNSLPEGIDTKIGEKATGLSEGQAQRIAIARALLKRSAVLILDEATSALDEKTEMKILDAISMSVHPTVLYVTHRRYLDKYADLVLEL